MYEDPITRQKFEGIARIIKCLKFEDTLHSCIVKFKKVNSFCFDESQTYQRKVDERDLIN